MKRLLILCLSSCFLLSCGASIKYYPSPLLVSTEIASIPSHRVLGKVESEGCRSTFLFFDFSTLDFEKMHSDILEQAKRKGGDALTGVHWTNKSKTLFFPIYVDNCYSVTGTIVKFTDGTASQPVLKETKIEPLGQEPIVYANTSEPSKKTTYLTFSAERFYLQKRISRDIYKFSSGFFWDSKNVFDSTRFWSEVFMDLGVSERSDVFYEYGLRILYPFSKNGNGFYFGSGGGLSNKSSKDKSSEYAFFIEDAIGFLIWRDNSLWRLETNIAVFLYDEPFVGAGLRVVYGFGI